MALPRGASGPAPLQTARFLAAKAVGSFVPALTRKAFEKFGFSTATLITEWPRIAGADLATYTSPEKLKWPRGGEGTAPQGDEDERRGATLVLRVDPARALDVEYKTRQIMDRINAYFGYRAIEAIRLVQAPIGRASTPNEAIPEPQPLARGDNRGDPLMAALARLEQGMRRRQAASV